MRYDIARPARSAEAYAHAAPAARTKPRRRLHPAFIAAALLIAAALCVALLLARARVTALDSECESLAGEIAELSDKNAHLTIDYEGLFTLGEIEEYAKNELGMVPG